MSIHKSNFFGVAKLTLVDGMNDLELSSVCCVCVWGGGGGGGEGRRDKFGSTKQSNEYM